MLTPNKRDEFAYEIYIAQPDADKEALAGKLFALIEIKSKKTDGLKMISFLVNALNHNYYQNEKMILRERISSVKIEHIFESALAKTNKRLAEFLQSEKIKINAGFANITVGVIYNCELHFANLGKNKALLIYQTRAENDAKYKITDISEQNGCEIKKQQNAAKLFSNIISGSVPRGGYFIFANETFTEYLSPKQIIGIITTLPPASAAEQIKNTLGKINSYVPFFGIIIKNTHGSEIQDIIAKKPAVSVQASIENLISTEEQTEKFLSPSGIIRGKKWLFFAKFFTRCKNETKPFLLKDKIFAGKKTNWLALKKILNFLKNSITGGIRILLIVFQTITDKQKLSEWFNRLLAAGNAWRGRLKNLSLNLLFWHKNLGKTHKILLYSFLACFLIFFSSIVWQNAQNKKIKESEAARELIASIEQKQNQIDANLLYGNQGGAKKLVEEIKLMIAELPQKNQEQKSRYNAMMAKNRAQMEKINRIIRSETSKIADFANLDGGAKPLNIIMADEKIFAADAEKKNIYSTDLKSKITTFAGQGVSGLDFPNAGKNGEIYYYNGNNAAIFETKTGKISILEIDYPAAAKKIINFKQYNGKYYFADSVNGQIYRFNRNETKLINAYKWLNSEENLSEIADFEVNADIFLLKNNGEILKYSKGKKQEFPILSIEPAFIRAEKITVSENQTYIYIFEPEAKRLAVFGKNGDLLNQYVADKLDKPKDFQIDEKNKKIYFLDGTSVYSAPAVHFKE